MLIGRQFNKQLRSIRIRLIQKAEPSNWLFTKEAFKFGYQTQKKPRITQDKCVHDKLTERERERAWKKTCRDR